MEPATKVLEPLYDPTVTAEKKRGIYDDIAATYDVYYPGSISTGNRCADYLFSHASQRPLRLLDAGCGIGRVGKYVRARSDGAQFTLVGLDYSAGMVREARETGAYDEVVQGDITQPFDLPGEPLDAVTCAAVFYDNHIEPAAFVNIAYHLRPGGFFAMTVREKTFDRIGKEYKRCFKEATCEIVTIKKDDYCKLKGKLASPMAYYIVLQKQSKN